MLRLAEIRKEKGVSQKFLADYLGISPGNLCEWEKGRIEPSIDFLNKIADFFDISIDYLVGREDDLGIKGYEPVKERISATEPLSGEEADLLKDFRKLGIFARSSILIQVRALAEKAEKEDCKYGE